MVLAQDVAKLIEPEQCTNKVYQETLLAKYDIPVQHLEFDYIDKCTDGRELEKIVQILRSGEEGYYPDLTKAAEQRLAIIKPKSRLLRKICPVLTAESLPREERNELHNDLKEWVDNISKDDSNLELYRTKRLDKNNIPDVREIKNYNNKSPSNNTNKAKRISSTDYQSWDKYDPDAEILKMDIAEEKIKREYVDKDKKKSSNKSSNKKIVQFKSFNTDIEALHEANYEKDKGNEFFKAGDYKEALQHYTNSINCKPMAPTYTNRALSYIKLKKYKNALDDCNSALTLDPNNYKAFLRKAQALNYLGKHEDALESVEDAIGIDPNSSVAQELANELRDKCGVVLKNTRFNIEEIKTEPKKIHKAPSKSKIKEKLIIPIPGTSNMSPPHYIECSQNNPDKIRKEINRANTANTQILHLVTIDNNSEGDDDDSCTVNHLKQICTKKSEHGLKEVKPTSDKPVRRKVKEKVKEVENLKVVSIKDKASCPQINKDIRNVEKDKKAGGEPFINENNADLPDDLHSPYSFLKSWNSANNDQSLEQHAEILRKIDINRIPEVIGCKLDNEMFSAMIKCLSTHFAVPGEIDRLHSILENIVNIPRFDIISLLMSPEDKNCVKVLINFLRQHEKPLFSSTINKLLN